MEFIKVDKDRFMIKDSNGRIVSKEEKLQLEKKELILEDIKGCDCQEETTKKIIKINEELNEPSTIKKTTKLNKRHNK